MTRRKGILFALWEMCCALLFTHRAMAMNVEEAYKAIPHRRTVFDEQAARMPEKEKFFLREFFNLIDAAIVEKVEIMAWIDSNGLKGKKEEKYDEILNRLNALETPVSLMPARQLVIEAIQQQREFLYRVSKVLQYKDSEERGIIPRSSESFKKFNDAKLMKRGIKAWAARNDYNRPILAQDPLVTGASQKLIKAYQVLIQAYPQEPPQNRQAFFDYLCALDFI